MYRDNRIVCVIPARGGSKGLPGKNIKELLGKPLIAYSIEHAKSSRYIDRVIVSTEDKAIAEIALKYGAEVPFMRPKELATDASGTIDVLLHAISWMESAGDPFTVLALLHVTTPLRSAEDVDNCIELLVDSGAQSIFSVTDAHRNPYFNMVEVRGGKVALIKQGNFVSRQSAPEVYDMNSSIYIWMKDALKEKKSTFLERTGIYRMPRERSVDIDDHLDFRIAEMLLREKVELCPRR